MKKWYKSLEMIDKIGFIAVGIMLFIIIVSN